MSATAAMYPIVTALVKAESMEGMGPNREWQVVNETQQRFLVEVFAACREEAPGIPEIESIASWSAEAINRFLRERGFAIQLQPLNPQTFGVASVLDLLVKWLHRGEKTTLTGIDERDYPGAHIKGGLQFHNAGGHNHPVVQIATKSDDVVFMTMLDEAPSGFDLVAKAEELAGSLTPNIKYGGLIFPMVDLNQEVDISWLSGLKTVGTDGQPAWITQALQQNILKMNEVGARVKSAVALGVARGGIERPDMIINGPFLVWFSRDGLYKPLFVGHITPEVWRDPGDITK